MKQTILFLSLILFCASSLVAAPIYVENVTRIKGQESTTIRGYGIVSGLNASGDNPKAYGPTARAILRMLELSGHPRGSDKEIGTSRNNALVEVTVTIPGNGAREGDLLDCTIASVGDAKSLENGVLSATMLIGPIPQAPELTEPLGMAWGKVTIEKETAPNVGKIKRGCRLTANFINPYIEDGNMTLVIRPEFSDPRMAFNIAASINNTFSDRYGDIAKAMNGNYIVVRFPQEDYANPMQFVAELMETEIIMERPLAPRVVINERVGIISIDDAVEVKPIVVTHKDIVAEIRPPLPPGQQELNPQQFVDIDTETKYRQFLGEPVVNQKLKALQASLDAVRIQPQDMIEIIKILERQGAIVGEVIYVD